MTNPSKGLAGVVAADTALSHVDGQAGRLIYRGYSIEDLGQQASFEKVVHLLWHGELPTAEQLAAFSDRLTSKRDLPLALVEAMRNYPRQAHPMAALRTAVSALGMHDANPDDITPDGAYNKAVCLTASLPTLVATWERLRSGHEPLSPKAELGHAANFLYMLSGKEPNPDAVRALDAYLVMLADHGFNASTFAARVTVSTLADVYSAVTTAIGTLKGAAHGGANQRAMEQFLAADKRGDLEAWYRETRAGDQRIMGIGHRVYKVEDPRARILRPMAEALAASSGQGRWYEIAAGIERLARTDPYFIERDLYANVDFYSAVVLYMIGLPVDQFTCVFAISRVAGWTAHILEQLADNRLIRPKANYTGPRDKRYLPLGERR
ncbi:MAG: citrate/2-methylcitrate synthase [Candidatus Promineifilaceae bacterium]